MSPLRSTVLASAALLAVAELTLGVWRTAHPSPQITFARDIAPIVLAKCAPCHRPGEPGPFSLLTYEDCWRRARQIQKVTGRRFMPPWKPVGSDVSFRGDRSLTKAQIDTFALWADEGAPLGNPDDLPPTPTWPTGWELGRPDAIVELPEPYALRPESRDVYRSFVIPSPVKGLHYVAAWEFRPGSRAVHGAILNVDRLGLARRKDAQDPEPGFGGMDVGEEQAADGLDLVWAPGTAPTPPNPARSWRLDEKADLVLQLHMQPRGKDESIRPAIGLYFAKAPPTEQIVQIRVGDAPIDIPPGDANYSMSADYRLPADVVLLSVFPHAHHLARTMRSWATLPDGAQRALLRIDDWDFSWQDKYTYEAPVALPAGSVISMRFVYDNSDANVRNPSRPPKRVTFGEGPTDEMGNVTYEVLPREARGLTLLRIARYEKLVGDDGARSHYNLANALADDGRSAEAMAHYARAIQRDPSLTPAHFNLANLRLGAGEFGGAITEYRATLALDATLVDAHVNLGHALAASRRMPEALAEYRKAAALGPRSSLAHATLGMALAKMGKKAEAADELGRALSITPDDGRIRAALDALADGDVR